MLRSESGDDSSEPQQTSAESGGMDFSALAAMLGGMSGSQSGTGSGLDMDTVMKLMQAVSAAGSEDKDRSLLLALRPHVSTDKQEKIDRAVKLLKLYAVVNSLRNSGMLGQLDKLI